MVSQENCLNKTDFFKENVSVGFSSFWVIVCRLFFLRANAAAATPTTGTTTRIDEGTPIGFSSVIGDGDVGNGDSGKLLGFGVDEGGELDGKGEFGGEGLGMDGAITFGIGGTGPGAVAVVMFASSEYPWLSHLPLKS